jgi:Peptidase family M28/PDZ domain/PA domain
MPVRRWFRPRIMAALLGLVVLVSARAANEEAVEARMRRDITFLASDECEGRGVDTKGIDKAAAYIAAAYKQAGLKPGGPDGSYFQPFKIAGAAKLEGPATLRLRGPQGQEIELKAGADFQVLGFSGSGKLTAPLVFAGFGVTAEKEGYDDYKGVDVAKKIVVLIRKAPRYDSPTAALGGDRKDDYAAFVTKISNAELHKAAAVLLVNDAGAKSDKLMNFADLAQGIGPAAIPAFHVRRSVVDALLRSSLGSGLREMQEDIDHDLKPRSAVLQGWTASVESHVGRNMLTAKNIIGVLEGAGPLAKETVVIGAHYDHLGYGGPGSGSLNPKVHDIHHGADDNASGTTTVIELARRFGKMADRQGRRLVFMAFSGEERGLLGSAYYCNKAPLFPLENTTAMVNLDMVGRMQENKETHQDKLLVEGAGTAKEFEPLLDRLNKKYQFSLKMSKSFMPNSDHASFYRKKVPVVFFWTGMHPDYHRPSDTSDKINVGGMRKVADLCVDVVKQLAAEPERPQYAHVDVIKSMGRGNIPVLGFVPGNYGETEEGVLVAEVRKDGAAAKGGVMAGDMIVAIAGQPIRNMGNYMAVMTRQRRGQPLEIGVRRNGKSLTLKVIPQ